MCFQGLQTDSADPCLLLVRSIIVSNDKSTIKSVAEQASLYCVDKQSIENMVKTIYTPCLEDWARSSTAAVLCQQLSSIELKDVKFRDVLLRTIQSDYKGVLLI